MWISCRVASLTGKPIASLRKAIQGAESSHMKKGSGKLQKMAPSLEKRRDGKNCGRRIAMHALAES